MPISELPPQAMPAPINVPDIKVVNYTEAELELRTRNVDLNQVNFQEPAVLSAVNILNNAIARGITHIVLDTNSIGYIPRFVLELSSIKVLKSDQPIPSGAKVMTATELSELSANVNPYQGSKSNSSEKTLRPISGFQAGILTLVLAYKEDIQGLGNTQGFSDGIANTLFSRDKLYQTNFNEIERAQKAVKYLAEELNTNKNKPISGEFTADIQVKRAEFLTALQASYSKEANYLNSVKAAELKKLLEGQVKITTEPAK
jgi:hypothetical protein